MNNINNDKNKNNKNKVSDVAAVLNLSTRRIQQLVKNGVLPTPICGRYDLANCIRGYEKYLKEQQLIKTTRLTKNSGLNELAAEKLRLLKIQVEKAELELEVLKDKYIEFEEVEFSLKSLVIAFRSRMLSLPHKLVKQIIALDKDATAIVNCLEQEIHDALMELSQYKYSDEDSDAKEEFTNN